MPGDDKPKKDSAYYLKKYGNYIGGGRYTDSKLADQTLPDSQRKYKDIVLEQAKKLGISPEILFASSNEEGVRQMVKNNEYSGDDKYPVDGFAHFGLDSFGDKYKLLVDKGYLPADMKFNPILGVNEKGDRVHTANFQTDDAAIAAKAAMLKDSMDSVNDWAARKGYHLSDNAKNFFMLAGYNGGTEDAKTGGIGNMQKMMDSYNDKGLLNNDAYLKQKPASYGGIYDNVMRRYVPAQAWRDDNIFGDATPQPATNTAIPANTTTQQPSSTPLYGTDGKIIAYKGADGNVVAAK